ncbi:MAG: hypothetical protein V3U03_15830 [Myxococcota bacterium]
MAVTVTLVNPQWTYAGGMGGLQAGLDFRAPLNLSRGGLSAAIEISYGERVRRAVMGPYTGPIYSEQGGTQPMANHPYNGYSAGYPSGWGGFGGELERPWWMDVATAGMDIYRGLQFHDDRGTPHAPGQLDYPGAQPGMGGAIDPRVQSAACCPTNRPKLPTAFVQDDPCGGSPRVYRNMGAVSSALMPGDFRAHRRVNKLAAKARRPRARARKR